MSQTQTQGSKKLDKWGIPDWRDASAYPDPENTSDLQWKWEFLRRREDYRKDWETYSALTREKIKEHPSNDPIEYVRSLHELEGLNPTISTSSELDFLAVMPGSEKKYGLIFLAHPGNPNASLLCGGNRVEGIMWSLGNDGISDFWGIQYSIQPYEMVLRFDLTAGPVWKLLDQLTKKEPLTPDDQDNFDLEGQTHASWLEIICWGNDSEMRCWRGTLKDRFIPRYLLDPQSKGVVHVILNRIKPFGPQLDEVKIMLEALQKQKVGKIKNRRSHRKTWVNYLRALDARMPHDETGKPSATYAEIGWELLGLDKTNRFTRFEANSRGKQIYQDALRLQHNFPV